MRKPGQRKLQIVLAFLAITRGRPPRPRQLAALPKLMHFRVPNVTEQEAARSPHMGPPAAPTPPTKTAAAQTSGERHEASSGLHPRRPAPQMNHRRVRWPRPSLTSRTGGANPSRSKFILRTLDPLALCSSRS